VVHAAGLTNALISDLLTQCISLLDEAGTSGKLLETAAVFLMPFLSPTPMSQSNKGNSKR